MTGKTPHPRMIEIGLALYPKAQLAAIYGLTDLFQVAGRLARGKGGAQAPILRVSHWQVDDEGPGPEPVCVFDSHPGARNQPGFIVLPPSLGAPPSDDLARRLKPWLLRQHRAGAVMSSVCAGAFLLAGSGLLNGRAATTHWSYRDALAARFPELRVDTDKLVIDDGDVITAGGLMAWTDLGLRLVDRVLGSAAMLETARFLLVDPAGREQRFYSIFAPQLQHGDAAILKTQHWLQAEGAREVSIATMARKAGLEERTFLRRFTRATGMKPTEYCQHLRIGKAREMLELDNRPIDQVAWEVGYADTGAFRKVFIKVMGLTPGEYRRRFGLRQADATA
ncbi:GlxA family transcriptional regulator [Dongia sp.]|uniref:GlxA family transcriptional regulator n=1 Tax=Dongia sp. TaxID=1977262 RepID=UPI0035AF01D1